MDFPERLKACIKTTGLNAEEFGKKVGSSKAQMYRYLSQENEPTMSFFQRVKDEFPWINVEWLATGLGEMEAGPGPRSMIATGDGIVQAGGKISASGGSRIGGVHRVERVVQVRENSEPVWIAADHPHKDDIEEIFRLLKLYGSPAVIRELKEKLLRIKAAVEGE
jgi:transcriptional regulator with XRE-family HTH domain